MVGTGLVPSLGSLVARAIVHSQRVRQIHAVKTRLGGAGVHRRGFSVAELLTAAAIILVLASIVFAVLSRAKQRAYGASTITNLRSLGQAFALYEESMGGNAFYVDELVRSGYIAKPAVARNDDPFKEGFRNAYRKGAALPEQWALVIYPYRASYLSWGDLGGGGRPAVTRAIAQGKGGGWLVDLVETEPQFEGVVAAHMPRKGTFRRLLFDGAVVSKHIGPSLGSSGTWTSYVPVSLLWDSTPEELTKLGYGQHP